MDEIINEIMDWFEFDRVHKAMVALDWQWDHLGGVPCESELRKAARSLLQSAAEETVGVELGTGGFFATRTQDGLRLAFVVSDLDAQCA